MRAFKALAIIFVMVASLVTMTGVVLGETMYDVLYVDDDGPNTGNHFQSLESAIAQANADASIYIAAGTYVLNNPLSPAVDLAFIGDGADVVTIDGTGLPSVFSISGVSVYIYGCSITGAETCVEISWMAEHEVEAYLHNNAIYGASVNDGIRIASMDSLCEVTLRGNDIYGNTRFGVTISSYESDVISLFEENAIHDNGASGIDVTVTDEDNSNINPTGIFDNDIYGNGITTFNTGVHVQYDENTSPCLYVKGNNIVDNYGHGIYIDYLVEEYVTPLDNASVPIVAWNIHVDDNTISGNSGDGICIEHRFAPQTPLDQTKRYDFPVIISDIVVSQNTISSNDGAGFSFFALLFGSPSLDGEREYDILEYDVFLEKNMILDNGNGGIVYESFMRFGAFNNLISGNSGPMYGMDLFGSELEIVNCTIVGNAGGVRMDALDDLLFANNIVASNEGAGFKGDEGDQGTDGYSFLSFYYNDIWGNAEDYADFPVMTGEFGNISEDPLFAGYGDAHLGTGSPCIDAGSSGAYPFVQDDLEHTPRPQGDTYDMGCYEALVQNWSPQLTQPLAALHMANATSMWNALLATLPADVTPDVAALIEQIQTLMESAVNLGNPIMTSGVMQQAQELMGQLAALN